MGSEPAGLDAICRVGHVLPHDDQEQAFVRVAHDPHGLAAGSWRHYRSPPFSVWMLNVQVIVGEREFYYDVLLVGGLSMFERIGLYGETH